MRPLRRRRPITAGHAHALPITPPKACDDDSSSCRRTDGCRAREERRLLVLVLVLVLLALVLLALAAARAEARRRRVQVHRPPEAAHGRLGGLGGVAVLVVPHQACSSAVCGARDMRHAATATTSSFFSSSSVDLPQMRSLFIPHLVCRTRHQHSTRRRRRGRNEKT